MKGDQLKNPAGALAQHLANEGGDFLVAQEQPRRH